MNKMKNNQKTKKSSNQVASSRLEIRCAPSQKALWVKAAQRHGLKLSQFVIARLNNKSKWISVDDRLPVRNNIVLCYVDNDFEFGMMIGDEFKIYFNNEWSMLQYPITHWMPLLPPEN